MSIAIAKAFPNIKCLPQVIGDLKGSENLEFVSGDMFDKIPHANAILLNVAIKRIFSSHLFERMFCITGMMKIV